MRKFSFVQRFLKKEDGSTTLMYTVALLFIVLVLAGFLQILQESFIYREINNAMDTSGIAALRSNIDEEKLRVEIFELNESQAKQEYAKLMEETLSGINHILDYRIQRVQIEKNFDKWKLGVTHKDRHQYTLTSVIVVKLKTNPYLENTPKTAKKFYDARKNKNFEVHFQGVDENGIKEMAIYNSTSIVYR